MKDSEVEKIAVLASGGLDSSILLAELAQTAEAWPIYVEMGLAWEAKERRALEAYASALRSPNIRPLTVLQLPIKAVYGAHWSVTGKAVPDAESAYDSVFLPGRNVLLIGLAAVWCSTHGVSKIAIGSLGGNPFPDATLEFFEEYGRLLSSSLAHPIAVSAPYRGLHKADIIRRHQNLPVELTLTCMGPVGLMHCGRCSKCAERQGAFLEAGVRDRTRYAG